MQRRFLLAIAFSVSAISSTEAQLIKELRGHGDAVFAVAFCSDGEYMASASFDHTIKIWNVETGRLERTFIGHQDKVLALAYSADGRQLASAGQGGVIRLWDTISGRVGACLSSRNNCVQTITFTPDGNRLIACGEAGIAEVWKARAGELERTIAIEPERMPLYAAAVSPEGNLLALAGLDGRIRLHDLATGLLVRTLDGHADAVYSLAFAPEGDRLVSGSIDQTVRCWRTSTGVQTACLDGHQGGVYQVSMSSDGRRLVSAGNEGAIIVWDADNGHALHSHRLPSKSLCAAFAPDGLHIGVGSKRSTCYLLELPRHVR